MGSFALFHGLVVALEVRPGHRFALAEDFKCFLAILHEFEVPRRVLRVLLPEQLERNVDLMVRLVVFEHGLVSSLELGKVHHALSIAVCVHDSNLLCVSLHFLFFVYYLSHANIVIKLTYGLDRSDLNTLQMVSLLYRLQIRLYCGGMKLGTIAD